MDKYFVKPGSKVKLKEWPTRSDDSILKDDGKAQLVVAENRNGPTGDVPLTFIKEIIQPAWNIEILMRKLH